MEELKQGSEKLRSIAKADCDKKAHLIYIVHSKRLDTGSDLSVRILESMDEINPRGIIATPVGNVKGAPYGYIDLNQTWINPDTRNAIRTSSRILRGDLANRDFSDSLDYCPW